MNGHFGLAGAYTADPTADNQRRHREREQELDRQSRAERWLWQRFAGRSFDSLESLTDAACAELVEHLGRALSETEHTIIIRACVSLNCGFVDAAFFAGKLRVTRGERVEFLRSA